MNLQVNGPNKFHRPIKLHDIISTVNHNWRMLVTAPQRKLASFSMSKLSNIYEIMADNRITIVVNSIIYTGHKILWFCTVLNYLLPVSCRNSRPFLILMLLFLSTLDSSSLNCLIHSLHWPNGRLQVWNLSYVSSRIPVRLRPSEILKHKAFCNQVTFYPYFKIHK